MKLVRVLVLFCVVVMAGNTLAHEGEAGHAHEGQAPEWVKYTTPGEGHAIFKDLVGRWQATSKWWMDATAKPEEAKGTTVAKLIMDGRFLQQEFKSKMMGKPFTGMGLLGYDALKGEYQSTWIDNMSTALMTSKGTYDAATKTLKEQGTASDPMTGEKDKWYRAEWKFVDKNTHTYSMFTKGKDGQEFKSLEINYKRN